MVLPMWERSTIPTSTSPNFASPAARESTFAVVQRVAKIASFIDPRCRNPRERHPGKLFDFAVAAARARISQNSDVWLIGNLEFGKHRFAIAAVVPNGNKIKFHLRIVFDHFQPAAVFEFGLTIGAPRRPKVNNA